MPYALEDLTDDELTEIRAKAESGWKTNSLAARFGVQAHVIRRILTPKEAMPISDAPPPTEQEPPVVGVASFTENAVEPDVDVDVGFGPDPDPQAAALEAFLANPALKAVIDAAVAERVAQIASTPQANGGLDPNLLSGFTSTIKHLIDTNAQQQPGYSKPLPADVVEERLAGKVEMEALLKAYEVAETPPHYKVGERGFFECTNAIELREGDELRTYLPPCEDFRPINTEARKVHAAMLQWIGGPSADIGELVKQAHLDSKAPLIGSAFKPLKAKAPLIEIVAVAPEERTQRAADARRNTGTIVPDPIDINPGRAANVAPVGPFA